MDSSPHLHGSCCGGHLGLSVTDEHTTKTDKLKTKFDWSVALHPYSTQKIV